MASDGGGGVINQLFAGLQEPYTGPYIHNLGRFGQVDVGGDSHRLSAPFGPISIKMSTVVPGTEILP